MATAVPAHSMRKNIFIDRRVLGRIVVRRGKCRKYETEAVWILLTRISSCNILAIVDTNVANNESETNSSASEINLRNTF